MKTTLLRGALAACALVLACGAQAQSRPCGDAEAKKAEQAVERVVNWQQLHKAWQDFGHCDSGALDDVFTDAVLRLMVEWRNVEGLAGPAQQDPKYKAFIHRHVLSPMARPDHPSLYSRAKASCPTGLEAFCAELAELVKPL